MSVRRILAACALALLVALHFDYRLAGFPFVDREKYHRAFTRMPDGEWEEYARFLEGVRAHTKRGDRIAVVVPGMTWDGTYSYAYYRASYFLAGREVLPLIYRTDIPIRENLDRAQYLAVWHSRPSEAPIIWRGYGGVLLRRQ